MTKEQEKILIALEKERQKLVKFSCFILILATIIQVLCMIMIGCGK